MKYLIIGAGGTGAPLAAYMTKGGLDVVLIARGEHLEKIKRDGLCVEHADYSYNVRLKACATEEYTEKADVIFLCVKGFSTDSLIDFIKASSHNKTVVIPLLNICTTGEYLSARLPGILITDGCIYISAHKKAPGVVFMHGDIFRVVFGARNKEEQTPVLEQVSKDLKKCGITAVNSDNIKRDALRKFSYVSAMAGCGLYYNCLAESMQREGEERRLFVSLVGEICTLAEKSGIDFGTDMVKVNLRILDGLDPTAGTSMQRDIEKGGPSEIDGLIYEVTRQARRLGLTLPCYEKLEKEFKSRNYF